MVRPCGVFVVSVRLFRTKIQKIETSKAIENKRRKNQIHIHLDSPYNINIIKTEVFFRLNLIRRGSINESIIIPVKFPV